MRGYVCSDLRAEHVARGKQGGRHRMLGARTMQQPEQQPNRSRDRDPESQRQGPTRSAAPRNQVPHRSMRRRISRTDALGREHEATWAKLRSGRVRPTARWSKCTTSRSPDWPYWLATFHGSLSIATSAWPFPTVKSGPLSGTFDRRAKAGIGSGWNGDVATAGSSVAMDDPGYRADRRER